MGMASTPKVVLGSFAFAVFWVLAVFPAVPFLPIGRTAGSLLGAMLMVLFQVITPEQAYTAIDLPILGLLFGTMVVSIYLERADMFQYLGKLLSWKTRGPKDLLCRICLVSAVCSALFTNDTSCVVLTEFVLKIARQKNLPPHPFLLALASSANIGSAATPIGNPQNLVIAVLSKITFGGFLVGILPAMLAGMCVNAAVLLIMYWKVLSVQKDEEEVGAEDVVREEEVNSHRFSPATMAHLNREIDNSDELEGSSTLRNRSGVLSEGNSVNCRESEIRKVETGSLEAFSSQPYAVNGIEIGTPRVGGGFGFSKTWTRRLWKTSVYVVTLGMLVALLMGVNMSWAAITAALTLIILDFRDARPSLEKVSYSLLLFFCGMFITVDGFNKTGIPNTAWEFMEPYAQIDRISGTTVLTLVILVLSNVASNVPTVLLLGVRVVASASAISPASERRAWLILAWVSTVGGNLSLLGSAANLIVCEQARRAQHFGYNLSFWNHLKFGVPSTLIVTAVGMALIRG